MAAPANDVKRGQKYGCLEVLSQQGKLWNCKCICGRIHQFKRKDLKHKKRDRCTCARREKLNPTKHSLYSLWGSMVDRCECPTNHKYKDYGGRGITVCERWRKSFLTFVEDMGPRPSKVHTLDRCDNDKGYSPSNCRWATRAEQIANRRNTIRLTYKGETKLIDEWATHLGIKRTTIRARLLRGWDVKETLEKPVAPWGR